LLTDLLQQYWNYPTLRPAQEQVIRAVLSGRDTLAILPTGGGKSLCYQLPAIAQDGFCLVISPLIALMQDQVTQLQNRGIAAAYIHSGMSKGHVIDTLDRAANNDFKLLYISPERLQTETFQEFAPAFQLSLIAVDEAHCISQWGHDFRPSYRRFAVLKEIFPEVPVLAVTASATPAVQEDIVQQLQLRKPFLLQQSVVRNNLRYNVRYTENKPTDISTLFHKIEGSGILYCRSRKRCSEVAIQLRNENIPSGIYHAGLEKQERDQVQARWTAASDMVISATTAFGMGIDKPDVRCVAHYDIPENPEEYYQEAGRAGRDGNEAYAVVLYNNSDLLRLQASTDINFPPEAFIRQVYSYVCDYLHMATGSGLEELRAFDAVVFARNFNLDILPTLSAIKILEREGIWVWNENTNTRSTVQFTTNRQTLQYLEQNEPQLAYVTTGLLRLYGSIYHHPTFIREYEDSRMMRIDKPELDKRLQRLSALGIIDYLPAISGSTLYWLHNRVPASTLDIDAKHIARLREAHRKRVAAMMDYIENTETCRNVLLANYFGENTVAPCGACDNCKQKQKAEFSPKNLRNELLQMIVTQKELSLQEIQTTLPDIPMSTIIDYIRTLSDEKKCRILPTGMIQAC